MDQEQRNDPFPSSPEGQKSNLSMLVGVGAFFIVLAGLGWYVYSGMPTQEQSPVAETIRANSASSTAEDAAAAELSAQGTSDDAAAIESDLRATNLDSLGDIDKL